MDDIRILYEDESVLGVYKPYGILSLSDTGDSLLSELVKYRKDKGEIPYVACVHRLDRTTQGAMVYSKTKEMTSLLCKLIKEGKVKKQYLGVFEGIFDEKEGVLDDLLFYDRSKNKSYIVKRERRGVKRARLSYKVINEKDGLSLLKIDLESGRTHQIRAQFSNIKHPIAGDRRYGSRISLDQLMLCSHRISFINPVNKENTVIEYFPDNDLFGELL